MKHRSIICLIAALLLVLTQHFAMYYEAYSASSNALLVSDPIVGLILEFALFVYLIFIVILSFFGKYRSRWPLYSLLIFWPLIILAESILGSGDTWHVHGLRDRIMHDYALDDLRHFARDVNGMRLVNENLSESSVHRNEAYALLKQNYPFMGWQDYKDTLRGPSLFNSNDNVVAFQWGGELIGRWGCSISVHGQKNESPAGSITKILRVSDDIYFFAD